MRDKNKKIKHNSLSGINSIYQKDNPFLVLSELNFPFIINLSNKNKTHLIHHTIINPAKRRL